MLGVYLHGRQVGTLERESRARLRFAYSSHWVETRGAALSLSLPVRQEPFEHEECAPFFEGLLPEGDFLRAIARAFHVSAGNPFALLSEIGGECAGAVGLGPSGGPPPGARVPSPRWLNEEELSELLGRLPERPLALIDEVEEEDGIRISLAGAHEKLGVLAEEERVGLTWGAPPSSHILKMPIARVVDPIANEAFCMALAREIGLDVAAAAPRSSGPHEFLLVRRYDRDAEAQLDGRLHQEDFCQALGVVPAEKYEGDGGPGVADCARMLWRASSAPARDITAFLDALLFNFLIGNHDAHSKNYSLLLEGSGSVRLAPLYDLLSTSAIPRTSRKLAMKYGGENRPSYLRSRHLERLADDLDVKPTLAWSRAGAMWARLSEATDTARRSLPVEFQAKPVIDEIIALVEERCQRLGTLSQER